MAKAKNLLWANTVIFFFIIVFFFTGNPILLVSGAFGVVVDVRTGSHIGISSSSSPTTTTTKNVCCCFMQSGDNTNNDNDNDESSESLEYKNVITDILSNFMQKKEPSTSTDPLLSNNDSIDFTCPKTRGLSLETLCQCLDAELYEKQWFVTGRVNPTYFDDTFQFQDPDVKLNGIEEYARAVNKLFDQETSKAEIISSVVNTTVPNTITVTWRLSGKVNIGPKGLTIKPYIIWTDFTVDETSGLIVFQEDRFGISGIDILLSSLFPFLIGRVFFLAPPAPPVKPRNPKPQLPPSLSSSMMSK